MKKLNIIQSALATIFIFATLLVHAQYSNANLRLASQEEATGFKYDKLQLYAIRANNTFREEHKSIGKYVTLREALQQKKIKITENS